jgi:hypothetical protein
MKITFNATAWVKTSDAKEGTIRKKNTPPNRSLAHASPRSTPAHRVPPPPALLVIPMETPAHDLVPHPTRQLPTAASIDLFLTQWEGGRVDHHSTIIVQGEKSRSRDWRRRMMRPHLPQSGHHSRWWRGSGRPTSWSSCPRKMIRGARFFSLLRKLHDLGIHWELFSVGGLIDCVDCCSARRPAGTRKNDARCTLPLSTGRRLGAISLRGLIDRFCFF